MVLGWLQGINEKQMHTGLLQKSLCEYGIITYSLPAGIGSTLSLMHTGGGYGGGA